MNWKSLTKDEIAKLYRNRKMYREHPAGHIKFAKNIMHLVPEEQQEKALLLFQEKGRVALKAGHGVGKTVFIVILMFHHLFCFTNSIVPCTAPTQHQLTDVLWTEAARWIAKSNILKNFLVWTRTRIMVKGFENIWYAVGIPSSNPDSLSGMHEKNLLYLLDEAPGIKEIAFPVIEGALTSKANKVAMIGNPTKIDGYFHGVFMKPQGWGTMTLSCIGCKIPGFDQNYAKRMANRFGENSNIYRVRVLGLFPTGLDDSILPLDLITQAQQRVEPLADATVIEGGADFARYGSDRTEMYIRVGYKIVDHVEIFSSDATLVQGEIIRLIIKWCPSAFKMDESTFGGAIIDNVRAALEALHIVCDIIGIYNQQVAVNSQLYENAATEMHFDLQETLKVACIPDDEELMGELSSRTYTTHRTSGRLMIIGKEALREKNKKVEGFKSPDKGEALAYCFYQVADRPGDPGVKEYYQEDDLAKFGG